MRSYYGLSARQVLESPHPLTGRSSPFVTEGCSFQSHPSLLDGRWPTYPRCARIGVAQTTTASASGFALSIRRGQHRSAPLRPAATHHPSRLRRSRWSLRHPPKDSRCSSFEPSVATLPKTSRSFVARRSERQRAPGQERVSSREGGEGQACCSGFLGGLKGRDRWRALRGPYSSGARISRTAPASGRGLSRSR